MKLEKQNEAWLVDYERAIEKPTSQLFESLRRGELRAKGRPLPAAKLDDALAALESENRSFFDIEPSEIPPSFWTIEGMHFFTRVPPRTRLLITAKSRFQHERCLLAEAVAAFNVKLKLFP